MARASAEMNLDDFDIGDEVEIVAKFKGRLVNKTGWIQLSDHRKAIAFGPAEMGVIESVRLIKRKAPEHWPPKPGDVWTNGTGQFFVTTDGQFVSEYRGFHSKVDRNDPGKMTLVYRRDVSPKAIG